MKFLERHGNRIGPALAIALAALAQVWLGGGTFGPDGAGAQASASLGGHPYPLHPLLIRLFTSAGLLSVLSAGLTAACGIRVASRLGASPLAAGLTVACAPLLLYPAALAAGDAPAVAIFMSGLATCLAGHPFLGALLAVSALGIKPIVCPMLLLLILVPLLADSPKRSAIQLLAGTLLGIVAFGFTLGPLLDPKPASGLLGSWWLSSAGLPFSLGEAPSLVQGGINALWALPAWTGHPFVGLLALIGALLPGPQKRVRITLLVVGVLGMVCVATLLGDQLRPRYLGPASMALVLLAAVALTRAPLVALAGVWPALSLVSHVAAIRSLEEGLPTHVQFSFPGMDDVGAQYKDSSICGAPELLELADHLAGTLPPNQEVVALRLRDGREGNLLWPLRALRPDLHTTVFHAGCCPAGPVQCASALLEHVQSGGVLISPVALEKCGTEVLDPGEQPIAAALGSRLEATGVYGRLVVVGPEQSRDACSAVKQPLAGESPR